MFKTRVFIAESDQMMYKKLKDSLVKLGYLVSGAVLSGRQGVSTIFQAQPDVVLMEAKLPGFRGMEAARVLEEHRLAPVILITSQNDRETIEEAKVSWVFGYLIKPVDEALLSPVIEVAVANFRRLIRLEEENQKLKALLENRQIIEQAKYMMMEKKGYTELEAHRFLQKNSMERGVSVVKVAQQVIIKLDKKE